ncbi:hypothetical protein FOZ63_010053 [Perkinsus olseni]|uniref:SWIM-type domain-containing protein n=1 Tax=Perkinsus olseni TaxID=32597 RepID=A0A7J6SA88_PEROL|nr:hypothetical protein FOZ63_010053 [Perkinsus olseni]KAF4748059.1 hypothetical protein FOZ62_024453 [Perkinsus olseni]
MVWSTMDGESYLLTIKHKVPGRFVTADDRYESLGHHLLGKVPRTLAGTSHPSCCKVDCSSSSCGRSSHYLGDANQVYLAIDNAYLQSYGVTDHESLTAFLNNDARVAKRVTASFETFDEGKAAINGLHLVTFKTSPAVSVLPANGGPRCSCRQYVRRSKCPHIVSLARHLAADSPRSWSMVEGRLKAKAAAGTGNPESYLPHSARYGIRGNTADSRRALQAAVREDGLENFNWPRHEVPSEEIRAAANPKDFSGCCGGIWDSDAVYCSSRRCRSTGWWHVDCAIAWARASGYPEPNLVDRKAPWYCPKCGRSNKRGRKRKISTDDRPTKKQHR